MRTSTTLTCPKPLMTYRTEHPKNDGVTSPFRRSLAFGACIAIPNSREQLTGTELGLEDLMETGPVALSVRQKWTFIVWTVGIANGAIVMIHRTNMRSAVAVCSPLLVPTALDRVRPPAPTASKTQRSAAPRRQVASGRRRWLRLRRSWIPQLRCRQAAQPADGRRRRGAAGMAPS